MSLGDGLILQCGLCFGCDLLQSLVQAMLGLGRMEPAWSSSLAAVLHSICFDAAESADVATCVALLQELLLHLRQVHSLCKTCNSADDLGSPIIEVSSCPSICCLMGQQWR